MDDERYSRLSPTERQEEYLRLLNEKNRLKRQMEQRRRTREEQSNQDRERGFVTHFSGANHVEKPRSKPKAVINASAPAPAALTGGAAATSALAAAAYNAEPFVVGVERDIPATAPKSSEGSRQRKRWAIDRENAALGVGSGSSPSSCDAGPPPGAKVASPICSSSVLSEAADQVISAAGRDVPVRPRNASTGASDVADADVADQKGEEIAEDDYEQDFEFEDIEDGGVYDKESTGNRNRPSDDTDSEVEDEAQAIGSPMRMQSKSAAAPRAKQHHLMPQQQSRHHASSSISYDRRSSFDCSAGDGSDIAPKRRSEREVIRVGSSHSLGRTQSMGNEEDALLRDRNESIGASDSGNRGIVDKKYIRRFYSDNEIFQSFGTATAEARMASAYNKSGGGRDMVDISSQSSPASNVNANVVGPSLNTMQSKGLLNDIVREAVDSIGGVGTAELDQSLVQRVAVLDPVQRLKLIDLLMGGTGVPSAPDSNSLSPTELSMGSNKVIATSAAESMTQAPTIPLHVKDPASCNCPPPMNSKDSSLGISDANAEIKPCENPEDSSKAYNKEAEHTPKEGANVTTISLENIRIRVLNGWNDRLKRKQVCLQGISVRIAANQSDEIEIKDLDLKIMNGFTVLSRNSEAAISAKKLFALKRPVGSVNTDWKGPIEVGAPLEVCFSGTITVNTTALEDAMASLGLDVSSPPIEALELCIRNGSTLPARDADVYIGSKCRWSGTLTDSTLAAMNRNGDMNLNVIPLRSEATRSKSSKAKLAVGKSRSEDLVPINASAASLTERNRVDGSVQDEVREGGSSSAPVWLHDGIKRSANKKDIFENATEIQSQQPEIIENMSRQVPNKSISIDNGRVLRKKEDVAFPEPAAPQSTASESVTFSPAAARRRSGVSANQEKLVDKLGPMPVLDKSAVTPGMSKRPPRSRDEDKALRQSLDALEHSDRLSRSRFNNAELEAIEEASHGASVGVAVLASGIVVSSKDVDALKTKASIPKIDFSTSETAKLDAQLAAPSSAKSSEQETQERRLKRRSERIGKVQETVRSALADLAGVMSTLSPSAHQFGRSKGASSGVDATPTSEITAGQLNLFGTPSANSFVIEREPESISRLQELPYQGVSEEAMKDGRDEETEDVMERSLTDIPVLPIGKQLRMEILSTWGDKYYVGLNGIDIFDADGYVIEYEHAESKVSDNGTRVRASGTIIENVIGNPSDINVLAEYENDPRHVTNLFDGVNFTRDDLHVWLAPQRDSQLPEETSNLPHVRSTRDPKKRDKYLNFITDSAGVEWPMVASLTVQFSKETAVSMIRVWNYNKSRAHSLRGVKRCRLLLDSAVVFDGEIRIASGSLDSAEANSEVILFTTDLRILSRIAEHDTAAGYHCGVDDNSADAAAQSWVMRMREAREAERPRTADTQSKASAMPITGLMTATASADLRSSLRPSTSVGGTAAASITSSQFSSSQLMKSMRDKGSTDAATISSFSDLDGLSASVSNLLGSLADSKSQPLISELRSTARSDEPGKVKASELWACKSISLVLIDTWGDYDYIGLNGIEVLVGTDLSVLDLDEGAVDADPRDLSVLGRFDDPRVPENLLDGVNDTTLDEHIWLVPFTEGSQHRVTLSFGEQRQIAGIKVWNYNKSEEDRLRGARLVAIYLDDSLFGHFVARIAPGCDGITFGQEVLLRDLSLFSSTSSKFKVTAPTSAYISPPIKQSYETPNLPTGMQWCFSFQSNWGDSYYIGLDAIEFITHKGEVLPLKISNAPEHFDKYCVGNIADRARCVVSAVPFSVNDLAKDLAAAGSLDQRTPFNLFLPAAGEPSSGHTCWLAPVTFSMSDRERQKRGADVMATQRGYRAAANSRQKQPQSFSFFTNNVLFVMFEVPVSIAAIRLYNYSKTPARGVKEFSMSLDGQLVFMGTLSMSAAGTAQGQCSVLFSNDMKIVRAEKDRVTFSGDTEQDVLHINDRQVLVRSKYMFQKPAPGTEGIYVDPEQRPGTSMVR